MSAINPPQAVALRDVRTDDVVTIESGDDELGSTITGRVHGVDTCKTAILLGDQIWYSLADGSDWRYVSGYRRAPEVEPGTVGTATVRGVEGVRVVRTDRSPENDLTGVWFTPLEEQIGSWWHPESEVTSFVPDPDTAALRAEVERLNGLIAMADRMGAQITQERNDLHAEVEAWQEWSNEVASMLPEEWDGDEAQQDIILRFVRAAVGEKARADTAEARLARACEGIAAQITSWQAENSERWAEVHTSVKVAIDAAQYAVVENLRDLLALVAADEHAAEGEAPAALPTRAQVFDILYPDGLLAAGELRDSKIDALFALFAGGAS